MPSLKVSDGFKAFVLDQLEEFGDVTPKAMFGAIGLYRDGVFFGFLARDALFLRVDARSRAEYKRARAKPFRPYPDRTSTKYFEVPLAVLESPTELAVWARKALAAARK